MLRMVKRVLVMSALLAAGFGLAPSARADGEFDGDVYLIISFDDTFQFSAIEGPNSQTILLNIGTFVGGGSVVNTRFINRQLSTIPLPAGKTFADFSGNEATVLGTFQTTGDVSEIHLVSPLPNAVPQDIQVAVHLASQAGALNALTVGGGEFPSGPAFPTTYAIASTIASFLPEGSSSTLSDIAANVFGAAIPVAADGGGGFGEGELFPHEVGAKLFNFEFAFDENGNFSSDVCLSVGADVIPGNSKNKLNLEKEGKLKVALLSSASFDATDVDGATGEIGGVAALDYDIRDVNHDGLDDIVFRFDVTDLRNGGALTASSTALTVRAFTTDGTCVEGTDSVDLH